MVYSQRQETDNISNRDSIGSRALEASLLWRISGEGKLLFMNNWKRVYKN